MSDGFEYNTVNQCRIIIILCILCETDQVKKTGVHSVQCVLPRQHLFSAQLGSTVEEWIFALSEIRRLQLCLFFSGTKLSKRVPGDTCVCQNDINSLSQAGKLILLTHHPKLRMSIVITHFSVTLRILDIHRFRDRTFADRMVYAAII